MINVMHARKVGRSEGTFRVSLAEEDASRWSRSVSSSCFFSGLRSSRRLNRNPFTSKGPSSASPASLAASCSAATCAPWHH